MDVKYAEPRYFPWVETNELEEELANVKAENTRLKERVSYLEEKHKMLINKQNRKVYPKKVGNRDTR